MPHFVTRKPQLRAGRFAQVSLTKQVGSAIDFTWLCINTGNGDGKAFIQVHDPATSLVWLGAALTIPAKASVQLNLLQTIQEPVGLRSLVAEMREGIFSTRIIASEQVVLNVTSFPVLTPVGLPIVNGIEGNLDVRVLKGSAIPISWPCENSGGSSGQVRLQCRSSLGINDFNFNGPVVTIPAHSSQTLLLAIGTSDPRVEVGNFYNIILSMTDINGISLGHFQFNIGIL